MSHSKSSSEETPIRTYYCSPYNSTRNCDILDPGTGQPIYHLESPLIPNPFSQTLHRGPTSHGPIVAAAINSWISTTIKLTLGDPNTTSCNSIKLRKHTPLPLSLNYNHYVFSLDLGATGEGGEREFEWKGTRTEQIPGAAKPGDAITRTSMKLVEKETKIVVARFVNQKGEGRRGTFEILKSFGDEEEWDRVVIMSSLALQEFWRKGTGLS